MRIKQNPIEIGAGIFFLILVSVIGVLAGFWEVLKPGSKATVAIGGVGALGTATLALATFWTIKQNETTLENLEKERSKPVILDMLAEVIDPIIDKAEQNTSKLSTGQRIWSIESRQSDFDEVNVLRPPSYRNIEVSIWHEFKEDYSELHGECERWWELVNELEEAAERLAEVLYEADEYDGISDRSKAVRSIMDATMYSEGADTPVDDIKEYKHVMYRNYEAEHHQYWRSQWNLLKLIRNLREDTIEMKRDLQREYGISNQEITEHQNTS